MVVGLSVGVALGVGGSLGVGGGPGCREVDTLGGSGVGLVVETKSIWMGTVGERLTRCG